MEQRVAIIGFGEAAQAFAGSPDWAGDAQAYDKLTDNPSTRASKFADYETNGVSGFDRLSDALAGAELILSLVTADSAAFVARLAAHFISPGTLYCEMNSVAPNTKRGGAALIEKSGGRFVDVAIMAPVHPTRLATPLLLSGSHALDAERALRALGFSNARTVGPRVGEASAIKMFRSVLVKGIEALTAEALLGAAEAGVVEEVLASLETNIPPQLWADRADYNLERMMVHGVRRADEMDEAVKTLSALGIAPHLTRQIALRQREIGRLSLRPAASLEAKLAQLRPARADAA